MSLLDFAKQRINPTADQEKAFLAMDDFLKSDQKCFLLKGYAGTGKTTITKTIAQYVSHKKYQPILLAPTGRAARILSDKTGFEANTIHRGIYNLDQLDEIELIKQYELAVGNMFVKHTENVYFQNKKLFVKLNSAALRQEVSFAKEALKEKLNSTMGRHIINEIVII